MRFNWNLIKDILVALLLLVTPVSAEIKNVSAIGSYIAGASESLNDAKRHAREDALRIATEQAGILVSSYSKTKNLELTDDEVTTVATKFVRTSNETYEVKLISDSSIQVTAKIDAQIDTDSIQDDIDGLKDENQILKNELDIQKGKVNIVYELDRIREEVVNKYQGKYRYKKYVRMPELTRDSSWTDCYDQFLYDMAQHDYYSAGGSWMMMTSAYLEGKPSSFVDGNICSFNLMMAERSLAEKDYRGALRLFRVYRDEIQKNHISNLNPLVEHDLPEYFDILYSFMEQFHPEWKSYIMKE